MTSALYDITYPELSVLACTSWRGWTCLLSKGCILHLRILWPSWHHKGGDFQCFSTPFLESGESKLSIFLKLFLVRTLTHRLLLFSGVLDLLQFLCLSANTVPQFLHNLIFQLLGERWRATPFFPRFYFLLKKRKKDRKKERLWIQIIEHRLRFCLRNQAWLAPEAATRRNSGVFLGWFHLLIRMLIVASVTLRNYLQIVLL